MRRIIDPHGKKPSGPITYKIEKGADVWTKWFFLEVAAGAVIVMFLAWWTA